MQNYVVQFRTLVVLSVAASLVQSEQLRSTPLQRFLDFVPSIERSKPACEQYNGMYNQCLPPREWMCDKPPVYDVLDRYVQSHFIDTVKVL